MANLDARVPISKVMSNVTMRVTVTGAKTMRVRMWIAVQLFKLGARLCGCGIEFTLPAAERPTPPTGEKT